jgi:hypothetical protein
MFCFLKTIYCVDFTTSLKDFDLYLKKLKIIFEKKILFSFNIRIKKP